MVPNRVLAILGCTVALVALPSVSAATTMLATYTGKISSGFDISGLFGPAGGSLGGKSFTAEFTLDTTEGKRITTPTDDRIQGGPWFGPGISSPISATLTIDGHTQAVGGDFEALGQVMTDGFVTHYARDFIEYHPGATAERTVSVSAFTGVSLLSLTSALPLTAVTDMGGFAGFHTNLDGYQPIFTEMYFQGPGTVKISVIPEPATWAMMIAGFGLAGARLRRTSRRPRTA